MVYANLETEFFRGPGIKGELRYYGERGCAFDVEIEGRLVDRSCPAALFEVLYQPRQPESGTPAGCPVRLLSERLDLHYIGQVDRAVGRSWLAGLPPRLVRQCYLRILPEPQQGA